MSCAHGGRDVIVGPTFIYYTFRLSTREVGEVTDFSLVIGPVGLGGPPTGASSWSDYMVVFLWSALLGEVDTM